MKRLRMGAQMRSILEILANLKNPEGYGYREADYGLQQTDIIMRAEGLKPYTETKKRDSQTWIKNEHIEGSVEELVKSLKAEGYLVEVTEFEKSTMVKAYTDTYEYTPPQARLASGVMGQHLGQASSPYTMLGRIQAVMLGHEHPEMRDDPSVKKHYDWVDAQNKGKKIADKLYASYSRSLKKLLWWNLISAHQYSGGDDIYRRHWRARYLLTYNGRNYLS